MFKKKSGFTLLEIIIVMIVLAILTAVSIPGILSIVENGHQRNRMNLARTVYLAAQNQLTEITVRGGLDDFVIRAFNLPTDIPFDCVTDLFDKVDIAAVYQLLGEPDSWIDESNKKYVYSISMERDFFASRDESNENLNPVLDLLSTINFVEVLNYPILIEFNVRTGVIFSVFVGFGHNDFCCFVYDEAKSNRNNNNLINGPRGMGSSGYEPIARARRQGFFSIGYTY